MNSSHEPWLVVLSLFVAFQGSYVGLHLARQVGRADGLRRRLLLGAAALSLALGIWTMHFVGILAVRLPIPVDFLVLPTLVSFLVCVLVVGFAVFAVSDAPPSRARVALAALFMGGGIVTMHYLGMSALHASLHMVHDPGWVAASVAIGVAASGLALWLGFVRRPAEAVAAPAALMALAISAMHYAAMAGVSFHPMGIVAAPKVPALSPGLLAVVVSVVAFIVSVLFLLTLVPERRAPGTAQAGEAAAGVVLPPVAAPGSGAGERPRTLPVEKDGLQRQLDVAHLVAVQAQAHYTQLFDGETTWFCPLPISEVEAVLDPAVFARIHRSHIVNLDRISSLKNVADATAVAMTARTPYRVPVSRARRRWLKQRLEERPHLVE